MNLTLSQYTMHCIEMNGNMLMIVRCNVSEA